MSLLDKNPVNTVNMDFASQNVTTSAWTVVSSALTRSASAVQFFNGSGSLLQIAVGATGSEVLIPWTIPPGGSDLVLDIPFSHGQQIQLKAIDFLADSGYFSANFFS